MFNPYINVFICLKADVIELIAFLALFGKRHHCIKLEQIFHRSFQVCNFQPFDQQVEREVVLALWIQQQESKLLHGCFVHMFYFPTVGTIICLYYD